MWVNISAVLSFISFQVYYARLTSHGGVCRETVGMELLRHTIVAECGETIAGRYGGHETGPGAGGGAASDDATLRLAGLDWQQGAVLSLCSLQPPR